ncbi:MAG: hypothetical protein ACF8Q5_13805 [Phycisphaerales bacterium JB040]
MPRPLIRILLALLLGVAGVTAPAQDVGTDDFDGDEPGFGVPETGEGEIELEVARFGVGNVSRPGSWIGVLVTVRDLELTQRNVLLRIAGSDPDGDELLMDRVVTTNPGVGGGRQSFWLYTKLAYDIDRTEPITVRAYEATESGADLEEDLGYSPGRLLGSTMHIPQNGMVSLTTGLYGVVGQLPLGLNAYGVTPQQSDYPLSSHELTRVVDGLTTDTLPDAWQGLYPFDVLVWGGTIGAGRDPGALNTAQANAIAEWVRRGGHFMIVLPSAGQEWTASEGNPLVDLDLLPRASVERREGVDLEPYRDLLTRSPNVPLPASATVHVFEPADDAEPGEADAILSGPDGDCVVMRRRVGLGAVTVIGMDFEIAMFRDTRVARPRVLPEAETFWNRVLGRRGAASAVDGATAGFPSSRQIGPRRARVFDDAISGEIAKSGTALQGLLLAVVLFFVFWIVAGPGGFALLAQAKLKRMAWVGFLAVTGVFTLVAWTGALLMRPKSVDASHVSMTLQVHGEPIERTRSWVNVLVPKYGTARIELDGDAEGGTRAGGGLIAPWSPATSDLVTTQSFPDNRSYRASARSPDAMRVPARQTVKQFEIDWAGERRMGSIRVQSAPGDEPRLNLVYDEQRSWHYLEGELVHDFPSDLTEVKIILVQRLDPIRPRFSPADSYANVQIFTLGNTPWQPDRALSLQSLTNPAGTIPRDGLRGDTTLMDLLERGKDMGYGAGVTGGGSVLAQYSALWVLSQLPPAEFIDRDDGDLVALRRMTHGLDVGRWFARPCVIVLAQCTTQTRDPERANPVPLLVDGRAAPMTGRSIVAWVYPLPSDPPEWNPQTPGAGEGTAQGTTGDEI